MKRKMVKATSVILTFAMMTTLCSCNGNKEETKDSETTVSSTEIIETEAEASETETSETSATETSVEESEETTQEETTQEETTVSETEAPAETSAEVETETAAEKITDDQALEAITKYINEIYPDLASQNDGNVVYYWEVESSDDNQVVVLFRSYTGALIRYYVDRTTGDTYVTAFVDGIMDEEELTDETLNVKDYL